LQRLCNWQDELRSAAAAWMHAKLQPQIQNMKGMDVDVLL